MKLRLILSMCCLLTASWSVAGNFRHYKGLSDDEVMTKAKDGDPDAILELGHRGKADAMPEVRRIASKTEASPEELKAHSRKDKEMDGDVRRSLDRKHARASRAARKALARLGDHAAAQEFIAEAKADGPNKQDAISALGYIADRRTAKDLVALLDDDRVPDVKRSGHELGTANSQIAENALAEMFPAVVEQFRKENPGKRFFFRAQWKKWWSKNKEKFQ